MKMILGSIFLATLVYSSYPMAMPILSADGSVLTGVYVDGILYDVTFREGVIEEVYSDIIFDSAYEAEANAVSSAIAEGLNLVGVPLAGDIAGCENPICLLFVPDQFISPSVYIDNNFASRHGFEWATGASNWGFSGSQDSGSLSFLTLVTFKRQGIPTPATMALFAISLAGIGITLTKNNA